jgi:hypothetical protein
MNGKHKTRHRLKAPTAMRRALLTLALTCLSAAGLCPARAHADSAEYRVKAAFLYNFSKFVEWPSSAFGGGDRPFVIGVLGNDPFGADLNRAVEGKMADGRPFAVRRYKRAADVQSCQILFVSESEKNKVAKLADGLENAHTLIVGDTDGFIQRGGAINFFLEDKKVRFEINPDAVSRAGLKVSSKLLALAKIVRSRD